ncbi:MAG: hypothetical protein ACR2QE_02695 [Acidimicrobiales bacterium]
MARRPVLWATAVAQIGRLAPPGWWRRRPFLPLPPADYLHFRMQTAYGDPDRLPPVDDVVTYLRWCRRWPSG